MHRGLKARLLVAMVALLGVAVPGALLGISTDAGATSAPTVTAVSPNYGPLAGGTVVTVTGTNFVSGSTTVHFGFLVGTDVVVNTSTSLTVVAPPGTNRADDIFVTVSGQTSAASLNDLFAYGAPTVTGVMPSGGPAAGGTSVIINGTAFVPGVTVAFGGTPAVGVILRSASSITAVAPAGTSGSVDVTVTSPQGTSAITSTDRFAYDVPSVEWISPSTGPVSGGGTVTIVGSGFVAGTTVNFGASAATSVVVQSPNALTVTPPPGAAGSVHVTVTTTKGSSANGAGDLFAYGGPPTISGVAPNTGPVAGGTAVVITGTNFTGATAVHFGSTRATSETITSGASLTAIAPAEIAGSADITVTTSAGTSTDNPSDLFAFGAPAVSAISPSVGTSAGGTTVEITGSGFVPGATVSFGSAAGSAVNVTSGTTMSAVAPVAPAGPVDITVTTPAGTSASGAPDLFTYGDLEVTGVSPSGGPVGVGTPVTIYGNGFAPNATVAFGGDSATDVDVQSPTVITATTPSDVTGVVDVTVSQDSNTTPTSSLDLFTFGGPAVTAVLPNAGPLGGGETVYVAGSGFVPGSSVNFGLTPSPSVTVMSSTLISATAPSASAGVVDISVVTPAGTSTPTAADQFTTNVVPSVSGLTIDHGPRTGGTVVVITGTGFTPNATVAFGSTPATSVAYDSPTSMTATSPGAGFAAAVDVTVSTPGGVSAQAADDLFAYAVPSVQSMEPDAGDVSGGTFVAVSGFGFEPGATVSFGSIPATDVTVLSSTKLTAVAPAQTAGSVNVEVTNGVGTSTNTASDLFAYGTPTISSVSPSTGPISGGTFTTIDGTGFTRDATVTFGTTEAAAVEVDSGTEIEAITPTGLGSEPVAVHTPAGDSAPSADSAFIFGGPAVTSVSPDSGPVTGGTLVTITGTLFTPDVSVDFGATPASSTTYVSPTSILAMAPPLAAGSTDVTVTNAVATSPTSIDDLFASGPATVTSVNPDGGVLAGGAWATINGTGFTQDSTVRFGSVPSPSVAAMSGTELVAVVPAGSAGSVDVTVDNGQGSSQTSSADTYTYGSPSVSTISPSSGPVSGGTSVTVTGSGFTADSKVAFGLQYATSVTVQSSTSLTAVAPSESAGVVDVMVVTPGGHSTDVTNDQFTYNNQLEISCSAPPYDTTTAVCPGIELPAVSLNGQWQAAQTPANTMYITDNRGDASAGWSVSAYLMPTPTNPNPWCAGVASFCNATAGSDSAYPDAKIPSSYLTIGNVSCTAAAGNPSPDPQAGTGGNFPDGSGAVSLCTAQAGQSAGTFKLGATYSLSIPPWVYAGQYQATVEYLAM